MFGMYPNPPPLANVNCEKGSPEGPWNHSFRLEQWVSIDLAYPFTDASASKLGPRLKVVALIDPATDRAAAVLEKKRDSFVVSAYQDTRIFKTFREFILQMTSKDRPRAVIIGSPPMFRGSTHSGRDIELQILKDLPDAALFIEKPIATGPEDEIQDGFKIAKMISDSKAICSVG